MINTTAGFIITYIIFKIYYDIINSYLLTFLVNVLNITFAFGTYKYYVFKTRGNLIDEYLRSYITYGSSMMISMTSFPTLIELTGSIELSYILITVITTGVSYIGHKKITFKVKNDFS